MSIQLAAVLLAVLAASPFGCNHRAPRSIVNRSESSAQRNVRHGVLVTWRAGNEIGRETFDDDGARIDSTVVFNGQTVRVVLQREPRHVRYEAGARVVDQDVESNTFVLENGQWSVYSLVPAWVAANGDGGALRAFIPSVGATVACAASVRDLTDGAREVVVRLGGTEVTARVDERGAVTRVLVPSQQIEVLPLGSAPTPIARRAPAAGVSEEQVEVTRGTVVLRGSLAMPASPSGRMPLVLFIAGSGPTDRDGNQASGLSTDVTRMMAQALAGAGIASLRYDKRGVGESGVQFAAAETTLGDFIDDAAAWVALVRADRRFSSVTVAGHSEGGLIALSLAQHTPVDGLLLLATGGRTFAAIVREQLARQLDAATLAESDRIFAAIRDGRDFAPVPPMLAPLFNTRVARFIRSEMDIDPVGLLRGFRGAVTVIQGDTDVQVTLDDARRLAGARADVRLVVLLHANHVFKDELVAALPQASYADPTRPLVAGLVDAMVSQLRATAPTHGP